MSNRAIYLVAEDVPGLAVGRKLVSEAPALSIYREENAAGFGKIKNKIHNYCKMAQHGLPVLLFTDLDNAPCAYTLIKSWLGYPPHENFLFRICVKEIEAWLLGDSAAVAQFLGISQSRVPRNPEALPDPKAALISLAQKAPRKIREGLTPTGTARIGPFYNNLITDFVATVWSPQAAAKECPSLLSARKRLGQLADRIGN